MDNNRLFVYEITISQEAIEGILDEQLTNPEWEYIQERITDMIESVGVGCAFSYERLSLALSYYRKGAN